MDEAFDEFVNIIYGAVLDVNLWKPAMAKLATIADAEFATLMDSDFAGSVVYREVLHNLDEKDNHLYLEQYAAIDPRVPVCLGNQKLEWVSDYDYFDDAFREKDRFYSELWSRYDLGEALIGTFAREGSRIGTSVLARTRSRGRVSRELRKFLDVAVPHLDRAVKISRRFDALAAEVILSHNVLDALPEPLGCALSDGRLYRANRAFEDSLRAGGVVFAQNGILHVQDPMLQAQFQRAIRECCRIAEGAPSADPGAQFTLRIERATEPVCFVTIAPLFAVRLRSWAGRPCALIRIDEPNRDPATRALEQAFGLSVAEARLVNVLCAGGTLAEAADKLGISPNTAKTQLASVFSKTGTSRQSELVALVAALPHQR